MGACRRGAGRLREQVTLAGCDKLKSRDQQNQGVHDFAGAKYNEAIEHFTKAVELDPTDPTRGPIWRLRTSRNGFPAPIRRRTRNWRPAPGKSSRRFWIRIPRI